MFQTSVPWPAYHKALNLVAETKPASHSPYLTSMDSSILRSVSNFLPKPTGTGDYSDSIMVTTLPLIGRVHIVNDQGGMVQISFVFLYWVFGTFSTLYIILLPQYHDGRIPYSIIVSKYWWIHWNLIWPELRVSDQPTGWYTVVLMSRSHTLTVCTQHPNPKFEWAFDCVMHFSPSLFPGVF